jgi:hypothetical protein
MSGQIAKPLDIMKDGQEYSSLLDQNFNGLNVVDELRRCIKEISNTRNDTPVICYIANVINASNGNSIDGLDELPFREMVGMVPPEKKEVDIILVTPGGLANQVVNFVNILRPRFSKVTFLLLDMAMSAGTIFIMSGDDIIMSNRSKFGPIDPQVVNKDGIIMPAQSILLAINDIRLRGEKAIKNHANPAWTDIQMLKNLDLRDVGNALIASNYSIQIVKDYLEKYKFRTWTNHQSGSPVTLDEKKKQAGKIASILCDHAKWKSHQHFIDRESAWNECQIKITHSENIVGLDRAMRRMWAFLHWIFDNTRISKIFVSENYAVIRQIRK